MKPPVLLLAVVGSANVLHAAQGPRPSVLFLFADDMRADTIAAQGNPHIQTPNLDRLAAAGFSFLGNYVFGGNSGAVCVPSRAMLMSGKTWFHVNTTSLANARLLPEVLRENGYVTFGTGKWHNGEPSWLRAFQRGKTVMFGGRSDHTRVPVRDLGPDGKLTNERTGEKFSSELFADSAIEFLENHHGKQPLFAYVAFTAPHDPRQPPWSCREHYYRHLPPLPANFLPQQSSQDRAYRPENRPRRSATCTISSPPCATRSRSNRLRVWKAKASVRFGRGRKRGCATAYSYRFWGFNGRCGTTAGS
jgi:arylsulfatase A-like enzyme